MSVAWNLYADASARATEYAKAIGRAQSHAMWARNCIKSDLTEDALIYIEKALAALDAPFAEARAKHAEAEQVEAA